MRGIIIIFNMILNMVTSNIIIYYMGKSCITHIQILTHITYIGVTIFVKYLSE